MVGSVGIAPTTSWSQITYSTHWTTTPLFKKIWKWWGDLNSRPSDYKSAILNRAKLHHRWYWRIWRASISWSFGYEPNTLTSYATDPFLVDSERVALSTFVMPRQRSTFGATNPWIVIGSKRLELLIVTVLTWCITNCATILWFRGGYGDWTHDHSLSSTLNHTSRFFTSVSSREGNSDVI